MMASLPSRTLSFFMLLIGIQSCGHLFDEVNSAGIDVEVSTTATMSNQSAGYAIFNTDIINTDTTDPCPICAPTTKPLISSRMTGKDPASHQVEGLNSNAVRNAILILSPFVFNAFSCSSYYDKLRNALFSV